MIWPGPSYRGNKKELTMADTTDTTKSAEAKPSVKKEKVEYTKPTSQVDLETRLADDSTPVFREYSDPAPVNEDGFVGVSPEYANAANDTDVPLAAEDGVDKAAEGAFADAYGDGSGPSDQLKNLYNDTTSGAKSLAGKSTTLSK